MKYWNKIIEDNKDYESALEHIKNNPAESFITRPEWEGIHFISKNKEYCILLKTGEVLIAASEVWDKDKKDWMIVTITDEAIKILKDKGLI